MTTLTIKDLPKIEELDHNEMAAVQGAMGKTMNQVISETVQLLHDIGAGKCEISGTGKSIVCY
jgi:demethoxyubiquinone hydroxylase (CLK1/Coq7/Cat5 family)